MFSLLLDPLELTARGNYRQLRNDYIAGRFLEHWSNFQPNPLRGATSDSYTSHTTAFLISTISSDKMH